MKDRLFLILVIIAILLYICRSSIFDSHHYKYKIQDVSKVGMSDTIGVYGDSIGWYNSNGRHEFFSKNSKIDTIK
jgi:hypothetical protein